MAASFQHEPEPAPPSAPRRDGPDGTGRPKLPRRTLWLAGALFVVTFAWSAGLLEKAALLGIRFFDLYAQVFGLAPPSSADAGQEGNDSETLHPRPNPPTEGEGISRGG